MLAAKIAYLILEALFFHRLLEDCSLDLPHNCVLPGREKVIPHHVFAADDAFPPPLHIMQPHGGRQEKGLKNRVFNSKQTPT
jgi:hypothetical protein